MRKRTNIIKFISVEGETDSVVSVVQFDNENHHIVVLNGCWAIVSQGKILNKIFKSAAAILKTLPNNPLKYQPYLIFIESGRVKIAI